MSPRSTPIPALLVLLVMTGCAVYVPPQLHAPPKSLVVPTGGPNRSAIFLQRVETGVVVFDLGWWGAEEALREGLAELGAEPDDVVAVFLTHSHRDHIAAWRLVRHAPFHLARPEAGLLSGEEPHSGWIPRWADKLNPSDRPAPGDIELRTFDADTAFIFGRDTVRAYLVPGHTAGSVAYLVRGSLVAGDAIAHTLLSGFRPSLGGYSADVARARSSLRSLRARLEGRRVESMCSAHLKCAPVTAELWEDLLGEDLLGSEG